MFNMIKRKKVLLSYIILVLLICLLHGYAASYTSEFWPMNGTFQNFNPIRRFLHGQVPCKDFSVYLGFGHLILGSIMTLLLGEHYVASLIAFSFLTILGIVLISLCIGKSILNSWESVWGATTLALLVLVSSFLKFSAGSVMEIFQAGINASLSPGNSARFIRGLAPIFFCLLLFIGQKILNCIHIYSEKIKKRIYLLGYSVIGGIIFTFSNDYGISSWFCFGIILIIITWARERKILYIFYISIIYLLVSIMSLVLFVFIITRGHFMDWFLQTFGTGGYQTWYYLSIHSHYIYESDLTFLTGIQGALVLYYISMIIKNDGSLFATQRYGMPAAVNLTAVCAVNLYKLVSGTFLHEVAPTILLITIFFEFISLFQKLLNDIMIEKINRFIVRAIFIVGIGWIISDISKQVQISLSNKQDEYIYQLGYLNPFNEDVRNASEFLGDKKIFSTYASAVETLTEQYQPSKYDYIIHVLGDSARKEYLEVFQSNQFDYVATMREDMLEWEYWVKDANWFFYRELYKNYHPVYSNTYELFWEKNVKNKYFVSGDDINLEVHKIDDSTFKLVIKTDKNITGIADVNLEYNAFKDNTFTRNKFMWFYCVNIKNTSDNGGLFIDDRNQFNLPKKGNTQIPIQVVNGYGEVTITSVPSKYTNLVVNGASVNCIFNVIYSYLEIVDIMDEKEGKVILVAPNTSFNQEICENISKIKVNDILLNLTYMESNNEYIYIYIDVDSNTFKGLQGKNTYVEVVKNNSDFDIVKKSNVIQAENLKDHNWTNGIHNENQRKILFKNTKWVLDLLSDQSSIECKGEVYKIEDIYVDEQWIHVTLDRDAKNCAYPNIINIKLENE